MKCTKSWSRSPSSSIDTTWYYPFMPLFAFNLPINDINHLLWNWTCLCCRYPPNHQTNASIILLLRCSSFQRAIYSKYFPHPWYKSKCWWHLPCEFKSSGNNLQWSCKSFFFE
jgi:hypothetical protein